MEIGEAGLGVGALADEALGLGGGERVDDALELIAEGLVDGGPIERTGAVGDAADRGQVIAVQEVENAGGALDVGIGVVVKAPEGSRSMSLPR
jgi:hypothetical protein